MLSGVFLTLWAAAAVAAPGGAATNAAASQPSLVSNGDFETLRDGVPVGWMKSNASNLSCQAEGTNHFLRLRTTEPGKMAMAYRLVKLPAGARALELRYRVRHEGIKPGEKAWFDGRIMMNFRNADGKEVKPSPSAPYFRGTKAEWREQTMRFRIPEGAAALELMPALFMAAAGTLDFDDFVLTPIDPAAIDAGNAERVKTTRARTQRTPGEELLPNGDFETLRNELPAGWLSKNTTNASCVAEGDNHFVRLRTTEPGKMVNLYRTVPLATNDRALKLTYRVRYDNIKPGGQPWFDGRVIVNFKGVGGRQIPGPSPSYFRGSRPDWRSVTNRFLVPADAVSLDLLPTLFMAKSGTLDLDDLHLTVMSDEETDAMIAAKEESERKKAERDALIAKDMEAPAITPEIKVSSNLLVTVEGEKPVWLQGLSCDSMQWGPGESILWSVRTALNDWHANVIRLAVKESFWFGKTENAVGGGPADRYRQTVDSAVKLCAAKGAYLVLDLHRFRAPAPEHIDFWKDAAQRYANNPAVLFELFNEPHVARRILRGA